MIYSIPTNTCYGLASSLADSDGYEGIYRLKWRDFAKPLAFLVRDIDSVREYVRLTPGQSAFLENYPYPFTLLAEPRESFRLPGFLDSRDYRKIGLRIAEKCIPAAISESLVYPLFLTSANRSGESECTTVSECREIFPHNVQYLDGGLCNGKPSNIFSFVGTSTDIVYVRRNHG